jgi:hypothetical protein
VKSPQSASLLAVCSLARGRAGGCAWCGAPLPPRRRTWCSDACGETFWNNHWWSLARRAAKRRDRYRCAECGHVPPKRPTRRRFPVEREYRAAMRTWRAERTDGRLEVNHRRPARGAHRTLSCLHHLDNLETLCVPCHRLVTAALSQGGAGDGSRVPARGAPNRVEVGGELRE